MKLGILGLGFSHPISFARYLKEIKGIKIAYVWDYPHKEGELILNKIENFQAEFGAEIVNDPLKMIDRGVDGVFIEVKNGERAKYALPFIEAKIPTFIDKPLETKLEDVKRIVEAIKRTGCPIQSNSGYRFAPAVLALKEKVQAEEYGIISAINATVIHRVHGYLKEPSTWQDNILLGGGSIINMGIHGMDPITNIIGVGVETVHCVSNKLSLPASQSEDTATINIQYKSGTCASIQLLCGMEQGGGTYFAVFGSKGPIEVSGHGDPVCRGFGVKAELKVPEEKNFYAGTVDRFLQMIETGRMPVPLEEIEEVILTLIAARISAAEKRMVNLSELKS